MMNCNQKPPAAADLLTRKVADRIPPGLAVDSKEFEQQAYLYHTSELGKMALLAQGSSWQAYRDAIRWHYKNTHQGA